MACTNNKKNNDTVTGYIISA